MRAKVTQVRACTMPKSFLSIAKYKMRESSSLQPPEQLLYYSADGGHQNQKIALDSPHSISNHDFQQGLRSGSFGDRLGWKGCFHQSISYILVDMRHADFTLRWIHFSIHGGKSVPKPITHNIVVDPLAALPPKSHQGHVSTLRHIVSPPSYLI